MTDPYADALSRSEPLTRAEEQEAFVLIEQGDEEARARVINANLRFVCTIAHNYQGMGLPVADLIGYGNQGLMTAVDRFDPSRGYKFISFAVHWIRQAIRKALSDNGHIRFPANVHQDHTKVGKAHDHLAHELGRKPTPEEVAESTGLSSHRVESVRLASIWPQSFDHPIAEDGSYLADIIGQEDEHDDLTIDVSKAISTLPERLQKILIDYYGLNGEPPRTLESIGQDLHLTRERVRQLKNQAEDVLSRSRVVRELAA